MTKVTENDDIRQELSELMKAKGITQGAIAKAIGRTGPVVSAYLKGSYTGNNAKLEKLIAGYLEKVEGRESVVSRNNPFIATYNAQVFHEVALQCHLECELGVLVADAGMGKTTAAREYAARNPEVLLISANMSYSARALFLKICELLDLPQDGNLNDLVNQVVKKLEGSGRFILVDQAEYLPDRALELLRTVYDDAGIGVLLFGMPRLEHNLKKARGSHAQIYSRVGIFQHLKAPLKLEEVGNIVRSRLSGEIDIAAFHRFCGGNARQLDKLIRRAKSIAANNNLEINADVVAEAHSMLMG
jgi:DNA transposition AAA+ family ATPase